GPAARPPASRYTRRTISSLGRQVKTTSAAPATPLGEPPARAPGRRAAAAATVGSASCTTRATPALARFVAMGSPMVPSPMNPTVLSISLLFQSASRILKKAHLLRCRPRPHAPRTESTPRVRPSGAASQLDLFEHPASFPAGCGMV